MTSLAHLRNALDQFSLDDFPRDVYRGLPPREAFEAFQAKIAAGKYDYTLDNKCYAFCEAYSDHLNALRIPHLHVSSQMHQYLMIPVETEAGTQMYIFDPTIQQFYKTHKEPYFLGTKEELDAYTASQPVPCHGDLHANEIYGPPADISESWGCRYAPGQVPPPANAMFSGKSLDILEGRLSVLECKREAILQSSARSSAQAQETAIAENLEKLDRLLIKRIAGASERICARLGVKPPPLPAEYNPAAMAAFKLELLGEDADAKIAAVGPQSSYPRDNLKKAPVQKRNPLERAAEPDVRWFGF
jgi:hypothetical protein